MDELPDNALIQIFGFLNLEDLANVKDVCPRFDSLCEHKIEIDELVISSRIEDYKGLWAFSERPIYYRNAVSVGAMLAGIEHLQINKHLKRLHIHDFAGDGRLHFDCSILTGFVELQQLDLDAVLSRKQTICSKSLQVLKTKPQNNLILETPNLTSFGRKHLNGVQFVYPEALKVLEASDYERKCSDFRNLECLVLEHGGALDPEILATFKQLKELRVHVGNTSKFARFREAMTNIFKQKLVLRRLDFKAFVHGVEVRELNKFFEEFDREKPFLFQIDHYLENANLLCRDLSYYTAHNYGELIALFGGRIPDDFTVRFYNIRKVTTAGRIDDEKHFFGFLKRVNLEFLHLKHSAPSQKLMNQLIACKRLIKLKLEDNINRKLNYDFLFGFKLLEEFSTDQYCPDLMRVASKAFDEQKYLRVFESTNAQFNFRIVFTPDSDTGFSLELSMKSSNPCKQTNRLFWRKIEFGDLLRLTNVLGDMINKDGLSETYNFNFHK